jgi:hypothetical protein
MTVLSLCRVKTSLFKLVRQIWMMYVLCNRSTSEGPLTSFFLSYKELQFFHYNILSLKNVCLHLNQRCKVFLQVYCRKCLQ